MGPAPGRETCSGGTREHVVRLLFVHLEDGATTREFGCTHCGAVWFD